MGCTIVDQNPDTGYGQFHFWPFFKASFEPFFTGGDKLGGYGATGYFILEFEIILGCRFQLTCNPTILA
jgi:hypothetical protein